MNQDRLVLLLSEYYALDDKIKELAERKRSTRAHILRIANPGRYKGGTIFKVKKAYIEVRAYTRMAYVGIRRNNKP